MWFYFADQASVRNDSKIKGELVDVISVNLLWMVINYENKPAGEFKGVKMATFNVLAAGAT